MPETPADAPIDDQRALVLTGERTLPGIWHENYWFQRHVVAYDLVAPLVRGRVVLDAGCGEGYGLRLLERAGAVRVIGVDLDEAAVAHAIRTYGGEDSRVDVQRAELMALPLDDDAVGMTISFQVIEHLHDIPGYLASLRRVTGPGGRIVIATPNRLTFTPDSDTPTNPFHTIEFTAEELHTELQQAGLEVEGIVGVHHGRILRTAERRGGGTMTDLQMASPPDEWPRWLQLLVRTVRPSFFDLSRDERLDESLDLIAFCREPMTPAEA